MQDPAATPVSADGTPPEATHDPPTTTTQALVAEYCQRPPSPTWARAQCLPHLLQKCQPDQAQAVWLLHTALQDVHTAMRPPPPDPASEGHAAGDGGFGDLDVQEAAGALHTMWDLAREEYPLALPGLSTIFAALHVPEPGGRQEELLREQMPDLDAAGACVGDVNPLLEMLQVPPGNSAPNPVLRGLSKGKVKSAVTGT